MIEHNHSYSAELNEKVNQINEVFFNNKSKNEQKVNIQFINFY